MSAEKEIVKFWLNSRGFYTINNIKINKSKDINILALKIDKRVLTDVLHAEISCSVSSNLNETSSSNLNDFVESKFFDKEVTKKIDNEIGAFLKAGVPVRNILIVGSLAKSKRDSILNKFSKKGIDILEFEDVLAHVMKKLDTQYYRDDTLRTLQLVKYLLLSNPSKLAELICDKNVILNTSTRSKFLNELLKLEVIKKGLTKTDEKQLVSILKCSNIKNPEKLAEFLEKDILNKRTRKQFMASLLKHEKTQEESKQLKNEKLLNYFFE